MSNKCYTCGSEVIWGGDHDLEEESDMFFMVSNYSCPQCHVHIEVYYPIEEDDDGSID